MKQISNLFIRFIFVAPPTVLDQDNRNGRSLGLREKQNTSMKIMNYTHNVCEKQQLIIIKINIQLKQKINKRELDRTLLIFTIIGCSSNP